MFNIDPDIIESRIQWMFRQIDISRSRYGAIYSDNSLYRLRNNIRNLIDRPMTRDAFQVMANEQFRGLGIDAVEYMGI